MNSHRLLIIAGLLGKNVSVADIGCDHGQLSAYLLQNGLADTVTATDISPKSLQKAERLKSELKLDKLFLACGDGFGALSQKPDAAVVAGMGGEVIAKMLQHPYSHTKLVLQPMKDSDILYKALTDNGFFIEKVVIAREDRRFYEIILAQPGKNEPFDYSLPPFDKLYMNDDAVGFLKKKATVLSRAADGAKKSDEKRYDELTAQLTRVKEVIADVDGARCDK